MHFACMLALLLISTMAARAEITADMLPITRGIIIDAGSSGSRLHIYEWEPRHFNTLPPPITLPKYSTSVDTKLSTGMITYSSKPEKIGEYLKPLIDFAKDELKDHKSDWWKIPIYLKATGDIRMISYEDREKLISEVRSYLLSDDCPFYFEFEYARVISGEEEGIYSWAAMNFLLGNLVSDSQDSASLSPGRIVGTLDMGRGSTQISFYKEDQDILSNMFKYQIGADKHWNVYTHSYLYYGEAAAQLRMFQTLVNNKLYSFYDRTSFNQNNMFNEGPSLLNYQVNSYPSGIPSIVNGGNTLFNFIELNTNSCGDSDCDVKADTSLPQLFDACMPIGQTKDFISSDGTPYKVVPNPEGSSFEECYKQVVPLLHKERNSLCYEISGYECAFDGVYMPRLPDDNHDFYAFSGFRRAWSMMDQPEAITLNEFMTQTKRLCSMTRDEVKAENKRLGKPLEVEEYERICFLSTYSLTLLVDGYGFNLDSVIHFMKDYDGIKVGWVLGSILHEINALPWTYAPTQLEVDYNQLKSEHFDPNCCSFAASLAASAPNSTSTFLGLKVTSLASLAGATASLLFIIIILRFWKNASRRRVLEQSSDNYGSV